MKFLSPYWTDKVKIDTLSRWILIHSYLYYELDHSIVPDHMFDNNCNQLLGFIEATPKEFKRSRYYYAFKDFDGSSGFGLYQRLNREHKELVIRDAYYLRERY